MEQFETKEKVAVFHVLSGSHVEEVTDRLYIYASVPYISNIDHHHYPYVRNTIDSRFQHNVSKIVSNIKLEFSAGRPKNKIVESDYNQIIAPQLIPGNEKTYRHALCKVAHHLTKQIGLTHIFDFLFSLEKEVDLLKISTDQYFIPWDWIYNKEMDKLLCEIFGIGVILPETKIISDTLQRCKHICLTEEEIKSSENMALIIANSYVSLGSSPLSIMTESIDKVATMFKKIFGEKDTTILMDADLEEIENVLVENAKKLSLIYISGHFHNLGFLLPNNCFLDASELSNTLIKHKIQFEAHPIVFLNGCSSRYTGLDQIRPSADVIRNLAETFLEFGAAACIVTSMEVRQYFALKFAEIFFNQFLKPGCSIGLALKSARSKLDQTKSFEWAAYHLIGDPSYVLTR